MTVATCLKHPKKGSTQLFRRNVTLKTLDQIFAYPRKHTGIGYYKKIGSVTNDFMIYQYAQIPQHLYCFLLYQLQFAIRQSLRSLLPFELSFHCDVLPASLLTSL
jgi:hypothetical protein